MELIDQKTKKIMEGCKERARAAGLRFGDETLEYIVTNRDLLELTPKMMIPTLYDYWVHDVEVLKEAGKYELYPSNPYETVINTRPAISYYNDNNPDWLNVMIFYHVLGHIDFFQNNVFFEHTWDYDFAARALSDKRVIAKLRSEKGRWVDYVIEFARGIDNLVGFHQELSQLGSQGATLKVRRLDYYFDIFLQNVKQASISTYMQEVDRYNQAVAEFDTLGEQSFFAETVKRYPEFDALYKKYCESKTATHVDLIQYLMTHSPLLNKDENRWMQTILEIVRRTSIFFQPQIRTKIMNEGWASYWHETLFLSDDRIHGHEVDFARVNAAVTAMPKVGLNPYALGMRLFYYIEEMADKGRFSVEYQRLAGEHERRVFDRQTDTGQNFIFKVRKNYSDYLFTHAFIDQDFMGRHKLFVAGKRLNKERMTWQYYIKSRSADEYKRMIRTSLYHPPHVVIDQQRSQNGHLYLNHRFEGKALVSDYIANTLMGIEYLWGGPVQLETSEAQAVSAGQTMTAPLGHPVAGTDEAPPASIEWQRIVYTMKDRKLSKEPFSEGASAI
jgi:stage V sporulation protein R